MINRLLGLREEERQRLASNPSLSLGDVTTVNLTMVEGGVPWPMWFRTSSASPSTSGYRQLGARQILRLSLGAWVW